MANNYFKVELSSSDWDLILNLIDKEIKRSEGIIRKTYKNPSLTVSSDVTRGKHDSIIDTLKEIQGTITTEAAH